MEGEGVATGRSAVLQPTAAEIFVLADAGASCAAASLLHGRIGKIDVRHNRPGRRTTRASCTVLCRTVGRLWSSSAPSNRTDPRFEDSLYRLQSGTPILDYNH